MCKFGLTIIRYLYKLCLIEVSLTLTLLAISHALLDSYGFKQGLCI